MINHNEACVDAWVAIAELLGYECFREHFEGSCQAYPPSDDENVNYEYFIGFEGDAETGLWTAFARVSVNREMEEVTFLGYKLPNGTRMEKPIKPTSFA